MLNYRFLAVIKVSRSTEVGWSGRMRSNQGLCGEGGWSKKREGSKQELLNAQLHVYKRQWVKSEREDVEGAGGGGLTMTSWGQEEENRGRQVRMKRVEGEADTELAPGGTRGGWRAGGIEREDHIHTFSSESLHSYKATAMKGKEPYSLSTSLNMKCQKLCVSNCQWHSFTVTRWLVFVSVT